MWKIIRTAVTLLLLTMGAATAQAQEDNFDPDNPPEPYAQYVLALACSPEGVAATYGEGKYDKGQEVTVGTYAENEHYVFKHWTRDGEVISEEQEFNFIVDSDATLVAVYEENPDNPVPPENYFTLHLQTDNEEAGWVEGPDVAIEAGTVVEIWAYANEGYAFLRWCYTNGEVLSEDAITAFEMPAEDVTLVACFEQLETPEEPFDPDSPDEPYAQFSLTTSCSPEGVAETYGDGSYQKGEEVTVGTYANSDHYLFVCWTRDGETVSEQPEFTFVIDNASVTLVAVYEENPDNPTPPENFFSLNLQVDNEEAGWVEGPDSPVEMGAQVEITAHANEGYMFIGWCDENGELVSGNASMTLEMPDHDVTLTACFEQLFNPDNPEEPYADQDNVDNDFDVNEDGDTDVADVMAIVFYLLDTPPEVFREDKADVNRDGDITIADATKLIDYLVGDEDFANTAAMRSVRSNSPMSLRPDENNFCVELPDGSSFTAFQMDVELPHGVELRSIGLDEKGGSHHQLLYRKVGDSTWRVVAFSLSNNRFADGTWLRIDTDSPSVMVTHIHMASSDGVDYPFADMQGMTTDIRQTDTPSGSGLYYDLMGRPAERPLHGIYILNGKKVTIP